MPLVVSRMFTFALASISNLPNSYASSKKGISFKICNLCNGELLCEPHKFGSALYLRRSGAIARTVLVGLQKQRFINAVVFSPCIVVFKKLGSALFAKSSSTAAIVKEGLAFPCVPQSTKSGDCNPFCFLSKLHLDISTVDIRVFNSSIESLRLLRL